MVLNISKLKKIIQNQLEKNGIRFLILLNIILKKISNEEVNFNDDFNKIKYIKFKFMIL